MKIRIISILLIALVTLTLNGQKKSAPQPAAPEGYKFTKEIDLRATSVKNQASTGTCWCFATVSFIESELLRMGMEEHDLSEMFIVRNNYVNRLRDNYLRRGKGNLGEGSLSHNAMNVIREHGLVPDEVYRGINYNSASHNHGELNRFVNAIAQVPVETRKESAEYKKLVSSLLDIYLGPVPAEFSYKGKNYTPVSFASSLGFNPDDYVEITSFSHFPFYTKAPIEVPDNWAHGQFYNVPIDEITEIMDYALKNGYTVNWDGDVSEKGFSHAKGVAIIPDVAAPIDEYATTDRARFEKLNPAQRLEEAYKFENPVPEVKVTQAIRQAGYENFTTTDDHLMHITGIVKDQNGTKYYITKNSWGTGNSKFNGYLNMSENFVKAKTIFIMVHKNAIPPAIKTKLGL
jgi:aminopeptidase C